MKLYYTVIASILFLLASGQTIKSNATMTSNECRADCINKNASFSYCSMNLYEGICCDGLSENDS